MRPRRGLSTQQRISKESFEKWTPTITSGFQFNRVSEAALRNAEVSATRAAAADFPSATFEATDQSTL
jgi:hypothetical protein